MPTNYPASLDTTTTLPTSRADGTTMATNHAADHDNVNAAAVALETKVGTGANTPTTGTYLAGTGTGTSAWTSISGLGGSLSTAAKSANYTILSTDDVILATGGSGAGITITLPSATTATKKEYFIKKVDSGVGPVIIGATIDGVTNPQLTLQYDAMILIPDGTSWWGF